MDGTEITDPKHIASVFNCYFVNVPQGSAAGEVQRAEFAVPCDMRKSHVALAGLKH